MDVFRRLAAAAFILVVVRGASQATDYFVDPLGSDFAAGTALAPWETLQHAADVVGPGDRVTVRPGNYDGFQLETSGSPAAPIEFFAEPGVFIDEPVPVRGDGINLEGASHVVIDGFNVSGMPRSGVRSVGFPNDLAEFVTIRNVVAADNGVWGIFTGHVNDLVIEDNHASGSLDEHGIYVSNSGDRPIIQNNVIWGNHGSGIHMNGDLSQGGDGIISNALVSGNVIFDNGLTGSGINMDGVQNSLLQNNLIYDNHASGISLYRIDAGGPASNNVVVNNTVHVAADGRWALNVQDGSTGNKVFNNILISEHATRGAIDLCATCRPGFVSDYNVVISRFTSGDVNYNLSTWQAATGNDTHSLVATAAALFVDPADGDYHLRFTSPARDAGTPNLAALVDVEGDPRPIGAGFDVGADEFALAGDYNGNGTVDAADYTVWRDSLGQLGDDLAADGNDDGGVDDEDYALWKARFGESLEIGSGSASAAAAPEPATVLLLAVGAICAVSCVAAKPQAYAGPLAA